MDATVPATRRTRKSIGVFGRDTLDKENATFDVGSSSLAANRKKSRSKSIGPGGLDGLKNGDGNRRASLAAPLKPLPRSILKSTAPIIPDIPPLRGKSKASEGDITATLTNSEQNAGEKIALRTEEEQQAAAKEREERERKEARRKSLANRRVSFAAEATLHTFHIEYLQDSTASTDSTRRASSLAAQSPASGHQSYDDQAFDQNKSRQSSDMSASSNYHNPDNDTIASTIYSSDSEGGDAVEEEIIEDSNSDSDADDGTMMSMDMEELTSASVASMDDEDESGTLDDALRLAARMAGTQRLDDTEEEEVIPSFGWVKKNKEPAHKQPPPPPPAPEDEGTVDMDMDMDMDMEMTHAVGGILKPSSSDNNEIADDGDMSMDVTRALGAVLRAPTTQQSTQGDDGDDESLGDGTMELTMAVGKIHPVDEDELEDGNEDMSMELTTAIGGMLGYPNAGTKGPVSARRRTIADQTRFMDERTMDMTVGIGRIISSQAKHGNSNDANEDASTTVSQKPATAPAMEEETIGMDMTTALGGILNANQNMLPEADKRSMEEKADPPKSPPKPAVRSPKKLVLGTKAGASLKASQENNLHLGSTSEVVAPSSSNVETRSVPATPTKPNTPSKRTGSSRKTTSRTPSPKRPSGQKSPQRQIPVENSTPTRSNTKSQLFQQDPKTGSKAPTVVLTPQSRRLSGVGADRTGLGSPRVAAIFDRRGSIGETSQDFVPGLNQAKRKVLFEDPRVLQQDIDREQREEEDEESRQKTLEREANGEDATLNLKEMIDSLSPRKNPLRGRKSLHIGSARGVLGKRPAELDQDADEAEENDGVKRLKGHQASPVKNVRLQQPPSKAETTTGRMTRSAFRSIEQNRSVTTSTSSTASEDQPFILRGQDRYKDAMDFTTQSVNFDEPTIYDQERLSGEDQGDRIHLQDFLNMTSIRFMELNTTRRRHTIAPEESKDGSPVEDTGDLTLEKCVVAGASTVPQLELYQHSCRELKKYISEGRRIVREIETETFEENPPLFREYISATPEVKTVMDNQFKNVKTHARLLSKAMWYEWRMKLQDGLKEGLDRIAEGMDRDNEILLTQEKLVESVLPGVTAQHEALVREHSDLQAAERELADCDPEELKAARAELSDVGDDIESKKREIEELKRQLKEAEAGIEEVSAQKEEYLRQIAESEKIREECRGWTVSEVNVYKARAEALERKHGWAITGVSGTTLSMTYKRDIELVLDIASFQPDRPNSRIDLWYVGGNRDRNPQPSTPEREFLLECIRDDARAQVQNRTSVPHLLQRIQRGWDLTLRISRDIRLVNITFPTTVQRTSDSSLAIRSSIVLAPLRTRVEVTMSLRVSSGPEGLGIAPEPSTRVVYGEPFNVEKMTEFVRARTGELVKAGGEGDSWSDVFLSLYEKLKAKGRKEARDTTITIPV